MKKKGRPRLGAEKRKMVCISLEPAVLSQLDIEAEFSGRSRSLTVAVAIEKYLKARRHSRAIMGLG